MPKSKVRKKKGKPVKYTPPVQGISKTKMKKLMELINQQKDLLQIQSTETPEIREGDGQLLIGSEFTKKLNVNPPESILEGPGLSEFMQEKSDVLQQEVKLDVTQAEEEEGPLSSGVE